MLALPYPCAMPQAILQRHLGGAWRLHALRASSLCDTWRAEGPGGALFVKSLPAAQADRLEAEADGLEALDATRAVAVPAVAGCWTEGPLGVLALQWLDFAPQPPRDFGARLGHAMAALHAAAAPGEGRFGWRRDNWLGGTRQRNRWSGEGGLPGWLQFVADERLRPLAAGLPASLPALTERVVERLPSLFDDGHVPQPSLIHGDLWGGNRGCTPRGEPVVFDPAVSVSDSEAELAMMELFGAPPEGFWPAYRERRPLAAGYRRRRALYQLVHLLNHARLFGGGYLPQSVAVATALATGRAG